VEINNTFYHLPAAETFDEWRWQAPAGFLYTLKFSRYATHLKHLKEPAETIHLFLDRANRLKNFLGPILVQLPPQWKVDLARLEQFLQNAPTSHRWALEFRNPGWLTNSVYAILEKYNAALVIHDLIPAHPQIITADWVYLRYHGIEGDGGNYSRDYLKRQAEKIHKFLQSGQDVFAYFNNDIGGFAVENARQLKELLFSCNC
jgi:uncharacterized protein YecE (DUF72 family)